MTSYLLDTHTLLWWSIDSPRLSPVLATIMGDGKTEVWVSVVSAWEIAIKVGLGKLQDIGSVSSLIERGGFNLLPIDLDHIATVKTLPLHHRDPFDRMLIAQAMVEDLVLVSNERQFDSYGIERVWD